jgi:rare lipoprotein A
MKKLKIALISTGFLLSNLVTHQAQSQEVKASWYGESGEHLSLYTSSGVRFNPRLLTAAHRSLPFGTHLRVTNLTNHRSIIVIVNDRGPAASTGRSLDLTKAAASKIGMLEAGIALVNVEVIK